MAYWIVGLDRSAFSLFAAALSAEVQVTTYQAVDQLFQVEVADNNPVWTRVIQGIDPQLNQRFIDHLESYEFRRPKGTCSVKAARIEIHDPFAVDQRVPVTLWLPQRLGREAECTWGAWMKRPVIRFVNTNAP